MKKKVLIAPLDWGLGHATRCIPIIYKLLELNCSVIIASSGDALKLLQSRFPALECFELPAYNVHYAAGRFQWMVLMKQLPRLLAVVRDEKRLLDSIASARQIDALISDNRYGIWSRQIPSVFITHQISPRPPFAVPALQWAFRLLQFHAMRHFDFLWIPDVAGHENLSGRLSHGLEPRETTAYIGTLSRYAEATSLRYSRKGPLVALLSGPEPQRSRFEAILLSQLATLPGERILVRGLASRSGSSVFRGVKIYNFLDGNELRNILQTASLVICRSGYSTLMDLGALGKKALLVPTPGQTEQGYLAAYHRERGNCLYRTQYQLDLEKDIPKALEYKGIPDFSSPASLKQALENLIGII